MIILARKMLKLLNQRYLFQLSKRCMTPVRTKTTGQSIELRKINQVSLITLNNQKSLNALNLEMIETLRAHLEQCERDPTVNMIIVKGAGGRAFCAGGDAKFIRECYINGKVRLAADCFRKLYSLNYEVASLKKPYVALLNGITMGGGVGISINGKYRVATDNTVFAMPETAIGFFVDVGGSHFLPRLKDNLGLYLGLTGNRLKGQDMRNIGLVTHFVPSDKLDALENDFFNASDLSTDAVDAILKRHDQPVTEEFDTSQINRCFSAKSLKEILENLEKENTEWSKQQLKTLSRMSLRSLKITIRQLELGSAKSLKECLEMDYQLGWRFAKNPDCVEGVRAMLVDKDNRPRWNPATHQEVDKKMVDWYFEPTFPDEDKLVLP
jgi:3-hydroxyisobutyryl-CoA hydrolase